MKQELVSIIVPIYNVEQYIEKGVKSLLNQDYSNVEIILVDDGSPDNSGKIIDELAQTDNRIVVIHKENGGVSSARNAGIEASKGKFLMFVDGDDYVDSDYVSYFVALLSNTGLKLGYNKINYSNDMATKASCDGFNIISVEKAMEYIYLGDVFVAVWNKIYDADFIKQNNIRFNEEIWYGEGMLFNIQCLSITDKVVVCSKNVYHQVTNQNSAMRKFSLESNHCGIKSMDLQFVYLNKKNKRLINAWKYHRWCFNWSILSGLARTNTENEHIKEYNQCKKNLRRGGILPFIVKVNLKSKLRSLVLEISPSFMAKREKKKAAKDYR